MATINTVHTLKKKERRKKHKERNRKFKNDPNQRARDYNVLYEKYTEMD